MADDLGYGDLGCYGQKVIRTPHIDKLANKRGFDEWFGYLNQRRAHTYYPDFIWQNEQKYPLPGNQGGKKEQYTHDLFTDFALKFIDEQATPDGGEPFFLYLAYTIPHSKYEIPSTDPYSERDWNNDEKVHAAMVTRMDRDIGRITSLLKERQIDKQTIVFFCSDNGAARRWEGRFDSSGDLRGRKRDLYEGGIRTPMIVRWPGQVPAGRVDHEAIWYFPDVLPTLADLAGVADEVPEDVDGVSVLPTLVDRPQPELRERFLYWEFFERGFQQAVRRGDWKAVRLGPGKPLELYDLSQDPDEQNNVADDHPRVVAEIEKYLETARTESEDWPVKQ